MTTLNPKRYGKFRESFVTKYRLVGKGFSETLVKWWFPGHFRHLSDGSDLAFITYVMWRIFSRIRHVSYVTDFLKNPSRKLRDGFSQESVT